MAGEIGPGGDGRKTGRGEQSPDRRGLVVAVFQGQEGTRFETDLGLGNELTEGVQTLRPRGQGPEGFLGQVTAAQVGIGIGDVGRVGDQGVQAGRGQGGEPVRADDPGVGRALAAQVVRRHRRRAGAQLQGEQGPGGALQGQGQGDGAAAGAGIRHEQGSRRGQRLQGQLDQQLGFGSGDEGVGGDPQFLLPEGLAAAQVGDGRSGQAPRQEVGEAAGLFGGGDALRPGEEGLPTAAGCLGEQQLRLQPGFGVGQGGQPAGGIPPEFIQAGR